MRAIGGKRRGASSARVRIVALGGLAIVAGAAAILLTMGRAPTCPCGHVALWAGDVASDQNSQQVEDRYSLDHGIRGVPFHAAGRLMLRRWRVDARLVFATGIVMVVVLEMIVPVAIRDNPTLNI